MQRTFNYTNRKRIEQREAIFSVQEEANVPREFDVQLNIDTGAYPGHASLYVEAYVSETRQRYDFGSIAHISPPQDRKLQELDTSGQLLFRVLVIDESGEHGLILGSGERFSVKDKDENNENKASIFSVKSRPLHQETWRVEFETGGIPQLVLNSLIPNAIEKMKSDAAFQALILPAALKQVLIYFLWNDESREDNEICNQWMDFAEKFAEPRRDTEDPSEAMQWVDEVVSGFSQRFDLCDRLVNTERGNNE